MDVIRGLARELAESKKDAHEGKLLPLPGQTIESCSLELGATSKTVGSSMAQLLTAANQGNENYTGIAARDTANALRVLATAVRGVAAYTKKSQTQEYIIVTAQQVMEQSVALISEAKQVVEDPKTPNKQMRLAQAAKAVSQALNRVVNCLPGPLEYDQAIKAIAQASLTLQSGKVCGCGLISSPCLTCFTCFPSSLQLAGRTSPLFRVTSVQLLPQSTWPAVKWCPPLGALPTSKPLQLSTSPLSLRSSSKPVSLSLGPPRTTKVVRTCLEHCAMCRSTPASSSLLLKHSLLTRTLPMSRTSCLLQPVLSLTPLTHSSTCAPQLDRARRSVTML